MLVIQSDAFNRSRINTLVVAIITGNTALTGSRGNVLLKPEASGLDHESVVNVSQILTIDKTLLTEYVGSLPPSVMSKVETDLRLVLAL